MNIKSRITKLERLSGNGLEIVIPNVEFLGGDSAEDCTHAIASWGDGNSFHLNRRAGETSVDFTQRLVEAYMTEFEHGASHASSRIVVLEHTADLL